MSSMMRVLDPGFISQKLPGGKIAAPLDRLASKHHKAMYGPQEYEQAPPQPGQTGEGMERARAGRPRGAKASVLSAANRTSLIGY